MTRVAEPGLLDRSRKGYLVHSATSSGREVTLVLYIEGLQDPRYIHEQRLLCRTSEQASAIAQLLTEAKSV